MKLNCLIRMMGDAGAALLVVLVAAMAGPVPAADSGPFSVDVFVGGRGGYPTYRIPAAVVSVKGTILAFCEGRKTGILDHGNIDLVLRRSLDRGATWGPLQVIQGRGFKTWGNPAPVVDLQTGIIWLLFTLDNRQVFVTHSDDDGLTWKEPREITADVKLPEWKWYATGPGHALQLASGRLLVPCDHLAQKMSSHVIYSDDHGQTWRLGGTLDPGTDEAMAFEAADGRVYLSMRNTSGRKLRALAWSADRGMTWSPVRFDEALVDSICQASILRFSTRADHGQNRALFLNPASVKREQMSIRISYDEAETWSEPRTIFQGPAAYSDMTLLPDLTVGVLYENGKIWPYSKITFTRLDLQWISGGKDQLR